MPPRVVVIQLTINCSVTLQPSLKMNWTARSTRDSCGWAIISLPLTLAIAHPAHSARTVRPGLPACVGTMHGRFLKAPGFTRSQGITKSRIDYAFVVPSPEEFAPPLAEPRPSPVTAAWVGRDRLYAPGNLDTDHRPLVVEIDEQRWLGSAIQMTDRGVRPIPETEFPPDRWIVQSEVERQEVQS